jgi:NAD(P)H-dependent flavin oxidoreductase YrpB (nitropropane dioxygenase family)
VDIRDRFSIEHPIFQAGMGSGLSGSELASSVSNAGGLGTVGFDHPDAFDKAILQTKELVQGRPYAANLLMPLVRRAHVLSILRHKVPIVSMFYGFDASIIRSVKESGAYLIYQIGSETEADRVVAAGADALIVQGVEAGGHVRGSEPLGVILPKLRAKFSSLPIIAAGGIWDKKSTSQAISLGADGVSCGTRFLMTNESRAHDAYKQRLIEAQETIVTTLFGLGWPAAPHRVLVNAAVERWCDSRGNPKGVITVLNWFSQFGARYIPDQVLFKMALAQRASRPLFTPVPSVVGMPQNNVEALCDYAGECVSQIRKIEPAKLVVEELALGC